MAATLTTKFVMTDDELKQAIRYIVATSYSKDQVRKRLRDELAYPYYASVAISVRRAVTPIARQAGMLGVLLGGLMLADGCSTIRVIAWGLGPEPIRV